VKIGRARIAYYSVVLAAFTGWFGWRALHPDQIGIRLHRNGAIEVNGDATDLAHLALVLGALDAGAARKTVTISADDDVSAAGLVAVVDAAHAAGVADVQFETVTP
jgi:biopolymer transport protein ExbD